MPFFHFETQNVRCATNPFGIKGAGEAGAVGSCPAVINAIVDALGADAAEAIDMPATSERVWAAIHGAKRRSLPKAESPT
jgi:carbon-monoxide dehydrogenase large subunit